MFIPLKQPNTRDSDNSKLSKAYDYLTELMEFIKNKDNWEILEDRYYSLACKASFMEAKSVKYYDLSDYYTSLLAGLKKAIIRAKAENLSAIFFHFTVLNFWRGNFFLCRDYHPEHMINNKEYNEDWAADFELQDIDVGCLDAFYNMFYYETDSPEICIYLVARTVACLIKAYQEIKVDDLAICISEHDCPVIVRLQEYFPPPERLYNSLTRKPVEPYPELTELEFYILRYYSYFLENPRDRYTMKIQVEKALFFHKDEILINRCPYCASLRRTPNAKQCPKCFRREP